MSTAQSVDPITRHRVSYPKFIWRSLVMATDGTFAFYAWMTILTAIFLVGANAWAQQVANGMSLTNMTDQVSWGLYIANFTFLVGLAAGAVMMIVPAYLYRDREMHDVTILGELLAIASIVMCLMFVNVDLGRPDRFWHLIPGIGKFHWPISMLTWDVIVLTGYLLLNLHIVGYLIYTRFLGRVPNPRWYVPFVFISIVWAISIHTVTAFLYCGLGSRPFWNSALLAPRFIASAFITGPAFLIITLQIVRRVTNFSIPDGPIRTLTNILRVTVWVNLFFLISELFTEFYTGGSHIASARYLYTGLDGHNGLVGWIWTAIALNTIAAIVIVQPVALRRLWVLTLACGMTLIGVWIEKGMGLITPGFVPSTLHEIVEYMPSQTEWKICAGIWAFGLMIYTVAIKIALPVLSGRTTIDKPESLT